MGVASGCGEQEAGVASGSGWNLWVLLVGVVVRRYIDFIILLIPNPLVSVPLNHLSFETKAVRHVNIEVTNNYKVSKLNTNNGIKVNTNI